MALVVIGIILLVGGGLLMWGWHHNNSKIKQLKAAKKRTVAELQQMATEVAKEIGAGSYSELVELRGVAECPSPLTSQLSKTPCIYYKMSVDREYEEQTVEYDQNRKQNVQRTRRSTTNMASNKELCPFQLRDQTGSVEVMPDGADIDAPKVLSKFEPEQSMLAQGGGMLGYGNFSIPFGGMGGHMGGNMGGHMGGNMGGHMGGGMGGGMGGHMGGGMGHMGAMGGTRTLGYRLVEYALPVGRSVYIMGEASDAEGGLTIHKPGDRHQKFVISTKSKEALIHATWKKSLFFMIGAGVAFLAGLGMIIGGLIAG